MSINKVILIGYVGKQPEIKHFDNGIRASFQLAVSERGYTMKNGTTVPDRAEWFNIVCSGGLAKLAEDYIEKGTQLYIDGKLRTRDYEDKNGIKRYITEVFADNIDLLGRAKSESVPQRAEQQTTSEDIKQEDGDDLPF